MPASSGNGGFWKRDPLRSGSRGDGLVLFSGWAGGSRHSGRQYLAFRFNIFLLASRWARGRSRSILPDILLQIYVLRVPSPNLVP